MKTKEEIKEEIETLKAMRGFSVTQTVEWKMFDFAIKNLEWVMKE